MPACFFHNHISHMQLVSRYIINIALHYVFLSESICKYHKVLILGAVVCAALGTLASTCLKSSYVSLGICLLFMLVRTQLSFSWMKLFSVKFMDDTNVAVNLQSVRPCLFPLEIAPDSMDSCCFVDRICISAYLSLPLLSKNLV